MIAAMLHLAPRAPWIALSALSAAFVVLGAWAYGFAAPPLRPAARRALTALRVVALLVVAWLLARPALVGSRPGSSGVVVLLDRSASMGLPVAPGGPARAARATEALRALERSGRARLVVLPFAARLAADTTRSPGAGATALGDALAALAAIPAGADAGAVIVVSDGAVNAGQDPVAAARALGLPVHAVVVGDGAVPDRALGEVEAPEDARTGQPARVRARVTSSEPRGAPIGVRLLEEGRERARVVVPAPGAGAEATAEFHVVPERPGLAVWTVRVDSLPGGLTTANDARQVAAEVAPGRLGVLVVSGGLNWDLTFLRRGLGGDSSLALDGWVRARGGWERLGDPAAGRPARGAPGAEDLRGRAVVVLDAIAPGEVGSAFERALAGFVREGGGLLVLGGPAPPGLARLRGGSLGPDLAVTVGAGPPRRAAPEPVPAAQDVVGWDPDAARGEGAWRAAAPLADVVPLRPGPGDRVLVGSAGGGPPLLLARRIGRGQALLVNGSGLWRWSLSGTDELSAERGTALWRRLVHWLAEPAQAEPLRVEPERRLAAGGEPVRLFATLQDSSFRPLAGADVTGELRGPGGRVRSVRFVPGGVAGGPAGTGSYVAVLEDLSPARYRLLARATRGGRELGRAACEFAVDRWSLELARGLPDSATLAAVAAASGGSIRRADAGADVERWARALPAGALARGRTVSSRLWESPLPYALVLVLLSVEWVWRRRRGLP